MNVGARVMTAALLAVLAGCSPYPYASSVKTFSDGVTTVTDALVKNEASIRTARAEAGRFRRRDLDRRPPMTFAAECVLPGSSVPCEQVERGVQKAAASTTPASAADAAVTPLAQASDAYQCPVVPGTDAPPDAPKPESVKVTVGLIAKTLRDYAKALAAVTNAADRAALDAAVGDLSGSAGGLAGTIGMSGGPAASAAISGVVTASVSLAGLVLGTALDYRRLEALDTAVRATCLPMQTLGQTVDTLIATRLTGIAAYRLQSVQTILSGMRPTMGRDEYFRRDNEIDGLLAAGIAPPDPNLHPGLDLRKAHDALVKAVVNREGQTLALIEAVGRFAEAADALETALDKARAR